jgi:hypothetical protein
MKLEMWITVEGVDLEKLAEPPEKALLKAMEEVPEMLQQVTFGYRLPNAPERYIEAVAISSRLEILALKTQMIRLLGKWQELAHCQSYTTVGSEDISAICADLLKRERNRHEESDS